MAWTPVHQWILIIIHTVSWRNSRRFPDCIIPPIMLGWRKTGKFSAMNDSPIHSSWLNKNAVQMATWENRKCWHATETATMPSAAIPPTTRHHTGANSAMSCQDQNLNFTPSNTILNVTSTTGTVQYKHSSDKLLLQLPQYRWNDAWC